MHHSNTLLMTGKIENIEADQVRKIYEGLTVSESIFRNHELEPLSTAVLLIGFNELICIAIFFPEIPRKWEP